jgi:hypothetical protein
MMNYELEDRVAGRPSVFTSGLVSQSKNQTGPWLVGLTISDTASKSSTLLLTL